MKDSALDFEVETYSHQALMELLTRGARTAAESLEVRIHGVYFKEYFEHLKTRTIVVENNYVDQHFLDDYAAYYVGCFHGYERMCRRIHFFDLAFSESDFSRLIERNGGKLSAEKLRESYQGFVVVKPLPTTLIGRTCLKTYKGAERHYPITKTYRANLFGIPLSVESIAFQEQDTVTAACATSALWSAFHCTGETFHHVIPSPHEITSAAKLGSGTLSSAFPNRGLTFPEMAQAVRSIGLEPLVFAGGDDEYILSSTLYAYLNARIPVVLGLEVFDNDNKHIGWHAVTITGYRLSKSRRSSHNRGGFKLRSDRINRIYAHDDQVGPFARMNLVRSRKKHNPKFFLTTSFGGVGTHYVVGDNLLVPVDKSIRIPFATICDAIFEFDAILKAWVRVNNSSAKSTKLAGLDWDIYLCSVNDFKTEIFTSRADPSLRRAILPRNLPKFVWRAKARINKKVVMEMVFDSTDIEQGRLLQVIVEHDGALLEEVKSLANSFMAVQEIANAIKESKSGPIFEHFSGN